MIESTMQDFPLTITAVLRHGQRVYADSECVTWTDDGPRRATFAEVGANANRLAARAHEARRARRRSRRHVLWNTQEHMEAYLAVPSMGAVLHTLNIRLFPEQLAYVINHAEDKVVIVDDSLVPVLAKVVDRARDRRAASSSSATVTRRALGTDVPVAALPRAARGASRPSSTWPEIDERAGRGDVLHVGHDRQPEGRRVLAPVVVPALARRDDAERVSASRSAIACSSIVPMFHANAWGIPYAAFMCGASLVMPGRFLQAEPLTRMVKEERVTFSGAVPTIWADILPLRRRRTRSTCRRCA